MNDITPHSAPPKTTTRLQLPALECPLPLRVDKALGDRINELLVGWVRRTGIFKGQVAHVRASNFGRFVMLCHPDTDDVQRLLLAAKCMAALFAVDDHYCDDERRGANPTLLGARLSRALATMDKAYLDPPHDRALKHALEDDPVLRALKGYMSHLDRYSTASQKARVRHETIAMFVSMSAQASWRIEHSLPQIWEYLAHRQVNSFIPCMALIDIVGGYELEADIYFSAPVREVVMLAASTTMIVNDLFSAAKEQQPDLSDFDLPSLLVHEQGHSFQDALALSADIHNALMRRYETKEKKALKHASPSLQRFLGGVKAWLAGNYEWHRHSGRYQV